MTADEVCVYGHPVFITLLLSLLHCLLATLHENSFRNGFTCRCETVRIDCQQLWDQSVKTPGGSTLQWGVGQGLMCLASHLKFTYTLVVHTMVKSALLMSTFTCMQPVRVPGLL